MKSNFSFFRISLVRHFAKKKKQYIVLFVLLFFLGAIVKKAGIMVLMILQAPEGIDTVSKATMLSKALFSQKAQQNVVIEAAYYSRLKNGKVQCNLCPQRCLLRPNQKGFCNVRFNKEGRLYTAVYGKVLLHTASAAQGTPFIYQGVRDYRVLRVGGLGCNLDCDFCFTNGLSRTPETALELGLVSTLMPEEVISIALKKGCTALYYTVNEPFINYEYTLALAKLARTHNLKFLLSTAGYLNAAPLKEIAPHLDGVAVGIKGFSEEVYKKYCQGSLQPVLENLLLLKGEGVPIEIWYLLIPTISDDSKQIQEMSAWVQGNLGAYTSVCFMRYKPSYRLNNLPPTPYTTLKRAKEIALAEGLKLVSYHLFAFSDIPVKVDLDETIECPFCQGVLIKREENKQVTVNLKGKQCKWCSREIPGPWQIFLKEN